MARLSGQSYQVGTRWADGGECLDETNQSSVAVLEWGELQLLVILEPTGDCLSQPW
jgi:hypothetical protein